MVSWSCIQVNHPDGTPATPTGLYRIITTPELEKTITEWVEHYNHERYHESLDNVTPADVYEGRRNDILDKRALVKARTMTERKLYNLRLVG
jgi:hypothetical protein